MTTAHETAADDNFGFHPKPHTLLRLRLREAGYSPIPLKGKHPTMPGWPNKHDATDDEIKLWQSMGWWQYQEYTGLITRNTPAIDIDISDEDAADAIEDMARDRFRDRGRILVRTGRAPRRAIMLRTDEPFAKINIEFESPSGEKQAIEILGDGQQTAAFGTHPGTNKPYTWEGGEPGEVRAEELPLVTRDDMLAFRDEARELLIGQFGYKLKSGGKKAPGNGKPRPSTNGANEPEYLRGDIDRVRKALQVIPNNNVDRGTWINIGLATAGAAGCSEEGLAAWEEWSRKAPAYADEEGCPKAWAGFQPDRIGMGTLVVKAEEAKPGWEFGLFNGNGPGEAEKQSEPQDGPGPGLGASGGGQAGSAPRAISPAHSDEALALRFADRHADDLRYVDDWGRWMCWTGAQWRFDKTRHAFDHARHICREVANGSNDHSAAKTIASAKTVAAIERLAKSDRRLAATIDQWDADPWLLNTPDGMVDLRTGKMRPARITDYATKITAVAPAGDCPTWKSFLRRVTGNDADLARFIQAMLGYGLTGITREHALFFLYGTGANGKSVLLSTVAGILADYHTTAPVETFTASQSERHPTDLAGLRGARLVTSVETEEGRRWAEAKIKALTGGDKISARFTRQDFFEFVPQFSLVPTETPLGDWLASHERPTVECVGRSTLLPVAGAVQRLLDGGESRDALVGILIALADTLLKVGHCRV